jgi:hypothetical protein
MTLCGNLLNQNGVNLSKKIWIIKKLFVSLYNYTDNLSLLMGWYGN